MRNSLQYLLSTMAFVLLISNSAASSDVVLDFGDAVVLDQSIGPVPIGDFSAESSFSGFYLAESDNYVLLLVSTPWKGVWSMVRTTHEGDLIDTIPHQMREPADNLTHTPCKLTWSSPYFYFWELKDANVYYTRVTEDLTLIDDSPQLLASFLGKRLVDAGGSQIWMMDDHREVWGYDAALDSAIVDGVTIVGWRSMSGVATRGIVHNGLYVSRNNPLDTVTDLAYISEGGEVKVLAPAVPGFVITAPSPHSDDSVVFWNFSESSGISPSKLQYVFASRSDSLSAQDLHEVEISDDLLTSYPECFVSLGHTGFLTGVHHKDDARWFAASIDFAEDSVLSFQYFGPRSRHSNVTTAIARSGGSASVFYAMGNGIEMTGLSGVDLIVTNSPHPILYGLGYHSWPSMIKDSLGLLVYVSEGTDKGSTIAGYRISDPVADNLANPLRIETPFSDSALIHPHIFKEDQTRGMFWMERLPDDISGYQSLDYHHKVSLIQGDSPTLAEVGAAHILNTTSSMPNCPPRTVRIRDTLYIVNGMRQSIDLVNNELTDLFGSVTGGSYSIVLNRADTLSFLGTNFECVEDCGMIGCCEWKWFLFARDYIDDVKVSDYNSGWLAGGDRDIPQYEQFLQGAYIDNQYYVALADPPSVQMVDFVSRSSVPVADLAPLLISSPDEYEAGRRAFLIPYQGYNTVLYFRRDAKPHEAFVFDSDWNLVTQQEIPLAGALRKIAGVEVTADSSTMVLAYTSYLPYPYSAERCLLQTISIDISTDVADEPTTPDRFRVSQNYPNPFNPETVIEYDLPRLSPVTLTILNVLGQRVRTLVDREEPAGSYIVTWDGDDKDGEPVASGVYFYRLEAGSYSATKKMMLLR